MKLDFELDVATLSDVLARTVVGAITSAAAESLRYGGLGRLVKEASDQATTAIIQELLSDEAFRSRVREALADGMLTGIRERGSKMARGMPLQQALAIAAPPAPVTGEGERPAPSPGGEEPEHA